MSIAFPAMCCSLASTTTPFVPTLKEFDEHPGPAQQNPPVEGDYWERIPAPVVKVVRLSRGTTADGSFCGDAGTLQLAVSLPASSTYKVGDFAVYFRVVSGKLPDEIFPNIPLVGAVNGKEMSITLRWLDGAPSQQTPLDLSVEVFFISNSMNIGASTLFAVKSDK